ncbi:glycosyltransferase family 4 protein [Acetobacteraceae bacterium]|nr:glycosyltransferase family 4 protein [Acetobacteraceae bacterium]
MKIHYLISHLEDSEAVRSLPDIFKILRELGHDISLFILSPPPDYLPNDLRNSLLDGLASFPCKHFFETQKSFLAYCNALAKLLRKDRPNLLITSQKKATRAGQIVGHFLNIPVASWQHGSSNQSLFRSRQHLTRFWIADSTASRCYLEDELGIDSGCILSWPNYQPPRSLLWPAEQRSYWQGKTILHIGFIASDHNKKSKTCLVKALSYLQKKRPNLSQEIALLIGNDPFASRKHTYTLKPPLSGKDTRRIARLRDIHLEEIQGNLQTFYVNADLLVQPMQGHENRFHLFEAMASGLPVITSPIPEVKTLINGGRNGLILSKNAPKILAEAINHYLSVPALVEKQGRNAHLWIKEHYNQRKFHEAGIAVIQKIEEILFQERLEKLPHTLPLLLPKENENP